MIHKDLTALYDKTGQLLLLLIFLLLATTAQGKFMYVSDKQKMPVRAGNGLGHKIVKMIPVGTRLQVIRSDPKSGYTLVRYAANKTGWVLSKSLVTEKPGSVQLAAAKKRIEKLEAELNALKNKTLTPAPKPADDQANRTVIEALEKIIAQVEDQARLLAKIKATNEKLLAHSGVPGTAVPTDNQSWFIWGAVVVGISFFTGILVTRIRWKTRSIWK